MTRFIKIGGVFVQTGYPAPDPSLVAAPGDAIMSPPAAWAANVQKFLTFGNSLNLAGIGLTDNANLPAAISLWIATNTAIQFSLAAAAVDLTNNALSVSQVESLLTAAAASSGGLSSFHIAGGTNGTPTRQVIIAQAAAVFNFTGLNDTPLGVAGSLYVGGWGTYNFIETDTTNTIAAGLTAWQTSMAGATVDSGTITNNNPAFLNDSLGNHALTIDGDNPGSLGINVTSPGNPLVDAPFAAVVTLVAAGVDVTTN